MNDVHRQNCRGNEAALAWRTGVGVAKSESHAADLEAEKQGLAGWVTGKWRQRVRRAGI